MRLELEARRAAGYAFAQARAARTQRALRDLPLSSAIVWRRTFAEQRHVWAGSWSRVDWPANRRPPLDTPPTEERDPVHYIGTQVA